MNRLVAALIFTICVAGAVAHKALHITHGATLALIAGAVIAFGAAVVDD